MTNQVETPQAAFHTVTPYLAVDDAAAAVAYYAQAFGAVELPGRLTGPDGKIGHTAIRIGDSVVMLADISPGFNRSPHELGGTPVVLHLMVDDVDATAQRAVDAGAEILIPVADQFYGMRAGRIRDPFGHVWILGKFIEKISVEEMERRFKALYEQK